MLLKNILQIVKREIYFTIEDVSHFNMGDCLVFMFLSGLLTASFISFLPFVEFFLFSVDKGVQMMS